MKNIKSFCKDDDTCIFVILVLIGFLLCMFFNRKEGFLNYAYLGDSENVPSENHNYGGIGEEPTKINENIPSDPDQKMKQMGKPEPPPGMVPKNPGEPVNGRMGLQKDVDLARKGEQYKGEILNNTGGIRVLDSSLDTHATPLGFNAEYSFYTPYAKFGSEPQYESDLGPMFPGGEPTIPTIPTIPGAKSGPTPTGVQGGEDANVGVSSGKKEMKLVLFYAPWCGHSKNMLGAYDSVSSKYNNKEMNGVTLSIIKIDMDQDKKGAEKYGVDIKGFPTLYTFVEQNGKMVSQPFSPRDEDGIVEELNKRTQAFNSQ